MPCKIAPVACEGDVDFAEQSELRVLDKPTERPGVGGLSIVLRDHQGGVRLGENLAKSAQLVRSVNQGLLHKSRETSAEEMFKERLTRRVGNNHRDGIGSCRFRCNQSVFKNG